jgi:hypothetical protein
MLPGSGVAGARRAAIAEGSLEAGEAGPYGYGAFPAQLVMPPLDGGSIVLVTDPLSPTRRPGTSPGRRRHALTPH